MCTSYWGLKKIYSNQVSTKKILSIEISQCFLHFVMSRDVPTVRLVFPVADDIINTHN